MTHSCKNCNTSFSGNFCSNYGQSANTHKINFHYLWHDIQHGLFHFENGILYSAKELFTRPGYSIQEFIEGKRVKHIKPLSLLIILATVYGLLYHAFHINTMNEFKITSTKAEREGLEKINDWVASHFSWAMLLTLPFYAIGSFTVFRKQGYNFIEHLVLNAFIAAQKMVVHIVTLPVLYLCASSPAAKLIIGSLTLIDLTLFFWTYFQFFNKLPKLKRFLLSLLSFVVFVTTVLSVSYLIGLILG